MVDSKKITTMKIDKVTKSRLDKLKTGKNESYDEVIQKILHILNICKASPIQAKARLLEIDRLRALRSKKLSKN